GYHAMACDAGRQRTVLFGGATVQGQRLSDTWEYAATVLVASGAPRPGQLVNFTLSAAFDPGQRYQMGSSLGTGPIALGNLTLGLSGDSLLAASVSGALPGVFQSYAGLLDGNGQAAAALAIPPAPALVGTTIHSAFVTVSPTAPGSLRSISNTESFQISR
ncbi:MAG: hypothetical protein JXQ29_08680, partial [Planctomycetes bacterium]|nr:hypothetical protein [Planctomycetota bacterium]